MKDLETLMTLRAVEEISETYDELGENYRCNLCGFESHGSDAEKEMIDHFETEHQDLALSKEELNRVEKEQEQRISTWKDDLEKEILETSTIEQLEVFKKSPDALDLEVQKRIIAKGLEASKHQLSSLDIKFMGSMILPYEGKMIDGYTLAEIDGVKRLIRSDVLNMVLEATQKRDESPEDEDDDQKESGFRREEVELPSHTPIHGNPKQTFSGNPREWQEMGNLPKEEYPYYYRDSGEYQKTYPEYESIKKSKNGFLCKCGKEYKTLKEALKCARTHLKKGKYKHSYPEPEEEESLSSQSESAVDKLKKALEKN
jgi:hypothetical protein